MSTKRPPVRLDYPFHCGSERARGEALSRVTVVATHPPVRRGALTHLGIRVVAVVGGSVIGLVAWVVWMVGSR